MATVCGWTTRTEERLRGRNQVVEKFFERETHRLAPAYLEMPERLRKGDCRLDSE